MHIEGLDQIDEARRERFQRAIEGAFGSFGISECSVKVSVEGDRVRATIPGVDAVISSTTSTDLARQLETYLRASKHARAGLEQALSWSVVGIISGSGPNRRQGIGTGTLVRWRGHLVILTAAHVVSDTDVADLSFLIRPKPVSTTMGRQVLKDLSEIPVDEMQRDQDLGVRKMTWYAGLDLAILWPERDVEPKGVVRYFDMAPGGQTPGVDTVVLLKGIPSSISRVTVDNEIVRFPLTGWAAVAPSRSGLRHFDASRSFLVSFRLNDQFPDVEPRGLSGAAIWFRHGKTPIWQPSLDLGGVILSWFAGPQLLEIARREVVERFLDHATARD